MKPILELKEIDKSFTGVHALDKVSFCCYPERCTSCREKMAQEKVHC